MCSPGTENKQVVSLSSAVPGRHNNMLEPQDVLANSSMLLQLYQYLPHLHPLFDAMLPIPWKIRSGDLLDDGHEKITK